MSKSLYVDNEKIATRYYAAGMEYRNDTLDFVSQPEGRVLVLPGDTLRYEYSLRDHLGDTRVTFSDLNHDGLIEASKDEIIQESHYDPWGMELTGIWQKQWDTLHPTAYLYNNKEFNEDFGLNWSDYGARWYDAAVGRWWVVDPKLDSFPAFSPFNYTFNNPIKLIDPDGQAPNWYPEYDKKTGHINLVAEKGDNKATLKQWANGAFSDKQVTALFNNIKNGRINLMETFIGSFAEGFKAEKAGKIFNCFSSVINGFSGHKKNGWGEKDLSDFKNFAAINFTEEPANTHNINKAMPFKSAFGYTQKDSGGNLDKFGVLDHVAINAGKDRHGNTWILSKDGYQGEFKFQQNNKYGGVQPPDTVYQKK